MLDWKYRPKDRASEAPPSDPTVPAAEPTEETPEGFGSRNVKIITFVICISLFLILFGPMNIFRLWNRAEIDKVEGKPMTCETVKGLAALGDSLTMAHLMQYEGEISRNKDRNTYTAEFEGYILLGVQDKGTGDLLSCVLSHVESGDRVNMTEDVPAFIEAHSK